MAGDDSLAKKLAFDELTNILSDDEVQKNLNRLDERDRLYKDISRRMTNKNAALTESLANKDFLEKYASKMQAPKGMSPQAIPEETARLGMKLPKGPSKIAKLLGKAGKYALGPAAALALDAATMEEAGDPDSIIEDPSVSLEERALEGLDMQEQAMQEMQEEAKREAMLNYIDNLKEKRLKRAQALMRKYGRDEE